MDRWLAALGASPFAQWIDSEPWILPVVGAVHVLGIAVVVGSVIALDARCLGVGRNLPVHAVARFLIPISLAGLAIAVLSGIAMFITKPSEYASNPAFRIKLILLILALVNAVILRRTALRFAETTTTLRAGAVISLILWTAILFSGRFVALAG